MSSTKNISSKRHQDDDCDSPSLKKVKTGVVNRIEDGKSDVTCSKDLPVITDDSKRSRQTDDISSLRRAKRLAMNRTSARIRRQNKKVLIASLQKEVNELSTSRAALQVDNDKLRARMSEVELQLSKAHATIASLMSVKTCLPVVEFNVPPAGLNVSQKVSSTPSLPNTTMPNYDVNRFLQQHRHSEIDSLIEEILSKRRQLHHSLEIPGGMRAPRDSLLNMKLSADKAAIRARSSLDEKKAPPTYATYGSLLRYELDTSQSLRDAHRQLLLNDILAQERR